MPSVNGASVPALADLASTAARRGGPWGDLGIRLASAIFLLPLAVLCIWWGGPAWLALLALGGVALVYEWVAMARIGRVDGVLLLAGLVYIALALGSLFWLRADPIMGRSNVMFMLIVVWASDIGAYLAGRLIGGKRLAPRISPGKTWSGAAGGLMAAMAAGVLAALVWPHGHWTAALVLALLIGLAAEAGDLLESLAKRHCHVKDSGRLIPGHGGVLDRVDGVLLAAPVVAILGLTLGRGVILWS